MDARRIGAGVLALLLVVVAVQVADPRFEERRPPEVDFSDPPAEVAATAAERFEYVDYEYRFDFAYDNESEWRQMRRMRVDNTDREFYKEGPAGDRGVVMYGTDAATLVRPGTRASWQVTGHPDVIYPASVISQPYLPNRIRGSDASVLSENSSFVTIRIDVHPVKVAQQYSGNATLVVGKNTGLVQKASIRYVTPNGPRFLRFHLVKTEIDVKRPADASPSPREIAWDVVRGPLVDLWT